MRKIIAGLFLSLVMSVSAFAQDVPQNNIWWPDFIRNVDLSSSIEQVDRYMTEIGESESASLNTINQYDMERIMSYNQTLRGQLAFIESSDTADLPHSFEFMYEITYTTEGMDFGDVENEALRWLERVYANLMVQLSRSESADYSNGISKYDYNRFILVMNKVDAFLVEYAQANLPDDLPMHSTSERADRSVSN